MAVVIHSSRSLGSDQSDMGKLRIGQRGKGRRGWVHLDSHPSADIVSEIPPLPPEVTEKQWLIVEGIHVWEHFYRWEAELLAAEISDILAPGGTLVLECPNLRVACKAFLGQLGETKKTNKYHMFPFYGDPSHKDPSYGHKWGYTPESLRAQLISHGGFSNIVILPAQHHVRDRDFRIEATRGPEEKTSVDVPRE